MNSKSTAGPSRGVSWEYCSFLCFPNPHWFLQPEFMWTYLPGARTLGWVVWSGAGTPHSCGIPHFYPPHVNVGLPVPRLQASPCISGSLPLHPSRITWLNPLLSNFHTAQFSDNSGWYLFCSRVVIFFCGCSRRRAMFTYIHLDWKAFITILLALFLMVYLTPSWLFCDYQYVLQNLFNFSTQLSNTCPTISTLATTYLFSVFVSLFLFHSSVYFSF